MSDASTRRMIERYVQGSEAPLFLSGHFQSPARNFHDSEKVEIDVIRDDEEVAIVLKDAATGARMNESSLYTNKAFTPPVFKEAGVINAYKQMSRQAGRNPFEDPNAGLQALNESFDIFYKCERKIRRAVELMSSQVLQTAVITLIDEDGNALYSLDFQGKSTHFPTVAVTWGTAGTTGDPLGELAALAQVVRRDGKKKPSRLVFGTSALQRFLANADVKARLDNRNMQLGMVAPEVRGEGATFQGHVWIGHYRFEMWSYDGFYKDPQSGELVPYVADNNVIMMSEGARLDLSFGTIPRMTSPQERAMPFLPPRISNGPRGIDLTTNAWFTPDGENLIVQAGTRPLPIPTAIDTYGCLTVVADS